MDFPGQTLKPPGGYRFQVDRLIFTFAILAVVAAISHALKQPLIGFGLIPMAMLFLRMNAYRFLIVILVSHILFFQGNLPGSDLAAGLVSDALVFLFLFLLLLSKQDRSALIPRPGNPVLFPLYLFTAYALVLVLRSLYSGTPLMHVAFDLRSIMYLPLAAVLLNLDGSQREPKKIFLLLASFVLFSSIYSLWAPLKFAATMVRVTTWNEIFISDAIIIAALLLEMPVGKKIKWLLGIGMALNVLCLIVIQTRGLWISTVFALAFIYGIRVIASRTLNIAILIWSLLLAAAVLVGGNIIASSLMGTSLNDIILDRLTAMEPDELINPYTSVGYRIHEAWTVWDQRTFFGHGTGATLHIFSTLYRPGFYMDWWSIHSGYFDMLHKFGFLGSGIFLWAYAALFISGWRKTRSKSRITVSFGSLIVAVLVNHAFVSISSGYFLKWGTIVLMLLYFVDGKLGKPAESITRGTAKAASPTGE